MDADTLRLILIAAGGLFLVGLYVWERRRARPDGDEPLEDEDLDECKLEPRLGTWHSEDGDEGRGVAMRGVRGQYASPQESGQAELQLESPATAPEETMPGAPDSPLILLLHVIPNEGTFDGQAIVHAANQCGVEPGEMDIFHRYSDPTSPREALFSLANMVKPGTFPFGAMAEFESPGLTLFSQAEGASDDPARLEDMLAVAHCLADRLNAEVCDQARDPLTPEGEERLRDRVLELVTWRLSDTGQE